jgi:hypothetical protein
MGNQEENHIFGVTCRNLHITYFDKREVCLDLGVIVRRLDGEGETGKERLLLACGTCGAEMVVEVECEAYK